MQTLEEIVIIIIKLLCSREFMMLNNKSVCVWFYNLEGKPMNENRKNAKKIGEAKIP